MEDWQEEDTDGGLKLCMEWNNLTAAAAAAAAEAEINSKAMEALA